MNAINQLIEKIKETNNPTVIGLDPRYEMLPKCVTTRYSQDLEGVAKAIVEFNKALIDNTCDVIPSAKVQIAFYEMYGIPGMEAFKETCQYAKEKGMIVIADIKRGDIGSTATRIFQRILRKNTNRRKRTSHLRRRLCHRQSLYGNRLCQTIHRRL